MIGYVPAFLPDGIEWIEVQVPDTPAIPSTVDEEWMEEDEDYFWE